MSGKKGIEVAEKIRQIVHRENDTMMAIVKEVDAEKGTCDVEIDGLIFFEVRVKSIIKDAVKGIKVLPAVKSVVVVERIGKSNELFITMFSEIDSITWEIENMKFLADKDGFVYNDGANKGMVKLPQLVQRLNLIESKVNDIITWTSTHTHSGVTAGPGTSGPAVGITGSLIQTAEEDIENPKVKH